MPRNFFIACLLSVCGLTLFVCLTGFISPAFYKSNYFLPADTSSFTANRSQGWDRMSVYLNQQTLDSAAFEIILVRKTGIPSSAELLTGAITNTAFLPLTEQNISYQLLPGYIWNIKITPSGQCFIKQTQGAFVPGNPSILFIKTKYKNK